jgi:hypothetical protein
MRRTGPAASALWSGLTRRDWLVQCGALLPLLREGRASLAADPLEPIVVSQDGPRLKRRDSGREFRPWGFNYDHDTQGRLLEDYWHDEWPLVERDFARMRHLGANLVRVHLQFGRFCPQPGEVSQRELDRLQRLVELAERERLYLDLTGLGCYHKADVPPWYDALAERERWRAQGIFWRAIVERVHHSPAIFCYDLMNEPVVSGGPRAAGDWLGPPFAGKHFVQFVSLDPAGRKRSEVARDWIDTLVAEIRSIDRQHLVTVGLVEWSLDRPGLTSGFIPAEACSRLDFLAVHLYPERGKLEAARETLRLFQSSGKPVLVEETFPLKATGAEFAAFLDHCDRAGVGILGFFWGQTPAELMPPATIADALLKEWLEEFAVRATSRK